MKYFIVIWALISTFAAFGQRTINIKVVSTETGETLSAFLRINNKQQKDASLSPSGYYSLNVNPSDTITIHSIKYPIRSIPVPTEDSITVSLEKSNEDGLGIFTVVDETASFPGGMEKFYEHVGKNMRYPKEAKKDKVNGRVFVEFVVNADGSIDRNSVNVLVGIHPACDKEAMRIVRESPQWLPGKIDGRPVRQIFVLPFAFRY